MLVVWYVPPKGTVHTTQLYCKQIGLQYNINITLLH
jgi:hypothetical protein